MINLNILALTKLTKLFLPQMIESKKGRIMNVASTAAFVPGPLMSVYYSTKAYVLSFSEAIANELKGTGVTVTTLCPGPTKSGFQSVAAMEKSKLMTAMGSIPDSKQVAEYGYKKMMSGQTVAIEGFGNNLLTFVVRFIPRGLVTAMVRSISEEK